MAPKPALAKTASMRPKRSSAAAAIASTWSHSVTSQRTAIARSGAAELRGQRLELVLAARAEHQPVAGLGGRAARSRRRSRCVAPVISRTGSSAMAADSRTACRNAIGLDRRTDLR